MIYVQLFLAFFKIGLFSVGGGYASLPLIHDEVVAATGWLTEAQYSDIVTISQMTPGPIAINSSTFVGIQVAGIWGAVASVLGFLVPSVLIVLFLVFMYYKYSNLEVVNGIFKYLQPAVVALIISACLSIITTAFWGINGFSWDINSIDFIAVGIFAVALFCMRKFKLKPVMVMMSCAGIGLIIYTII